MAESESIEFLKTRVAEAVADNLKTIANSRVDQTQAVTEILEYVFKDVDPKLASLDHARYDWYYALLGKGIAIAQGWKINSTPELKNALETKESIRLYLEKTYGQKVGV
ncbi:MAG: hypothetical protein K8S54_18985 [Spirochaetia bacterium]|nr:hypothetical protein [Spirochaetia bacterium]